MEGGRNGWYVVRVLLEGQSEVVMKDRTVSKCGYDSESLWFLDARIRLSGYGGSQRVQAESLAVASH